MANTQWILHIQNLFTILKHFKNNQIYKLINLGFTQ